MYDARNTRTLTLLGDFTTVTASAGAAAEVRAAQMRAALDIRERPNTDSLSENVSLGTGSAASALAFCPSLSNMSER